MPKFSNLKIGTKLIILISLLTIAIVTLISVIIGYKVQQMSEDSAEVIARETAYHHMYAVKTKLEVALDEARAISEFFESFAHANITTNAANNTSIDISTGISTGNSPALTRQLANSVLQRFIEHSPEFLAIYVVFEPNAFDGRDAEFIGQIGHDNTGRFIPYWTRNEKGVGIVEPVVNYDVEEKGDYYFIPKKTKEEAVIDPYFYPVQGKDVLMTSLVVPIVDAQNNFIGIAGIDLDLQKVQQITKELVSDEYATAYTSLYSANGTVVFSGISAQQGKNVKDVNANDPAFVNAVLDKHSFFVKRFSQAIQDTVISYGAKLEIGYSGIFWAVVVNIPEKEFNQAAYFLIIQLIVISSIAILIMIFAVYWIAKQISCSLHGMVATSEAIAAGKLDNVIVITGKDESGQLLSAFHKMQHELRERFVTINQSANIVMNAARELAQGNANLSQRTTEQAATLEETAASMEQMTGSVQQNADNAKQANQLSMNAKEQAEQGNCVVKKAVLAISEIEKSSKEITDIITVIDEIAFQTNLLALNAAVEAARAGEQGRGFAVVAAEVRNLAQRSAAAAKEIKTLIKDSNAKVGEGTRLANQSGQALEELVIAVKKVNGIINEIATASAEQSMGISQVSKAICQMDNIVEQNSAMVEQAYAASESMKEQAEILKEQVAFFDLGT